MSGTIGNWRDISIGGISFRHEDGTPGSLNYGGSHIKELAPTNGAPDVMIGNAQGGVHGIPLRLFHQDGSVKAFQDLMAQDIEDGGVSGSITGPDGIKYVPDGGWRIVLPDGLQADFSNGNTLVDLVAKNGIIKPI